MTGWAVREGSYIDRDAVLAGLVGVLDLIAQPPTTCVTDGCLVLSTETCPACLVRRRTEKENA